MASVDWRQQSFRIVTQNGLEDATGWVCGPFGIRQVAGRWRLFWTVTHLASGTLLTPGGGTGFSSMALAQTFAEKLLPLADWSADRALAADDTLAERVVAIWNELITLDVISTNMTIAALAHPQRENRAARRRKRH